MQWCLLLCMGFLNYFCNISIHRQKKNCLAYWNLQTWSLHREGKIIPIAHLTRRPVHLPTSKEHGDEHDRQTGPHLNLHSPPFCSPPSGPDQQHISCQQSSNAQEAGKKKKKVSQALVIYSFIVSCPHVTNYQVEKFKSY